MRYYFMIFDYFLIKKYKVFLNIINNSIIFLSKYYIYFEILAFSNFIILLSIIIAKIIFKTSWQNIILNEIQKKNI